MVDCAIVGAGPGGLATAASLRRHGLAPVVLERGPGPGAKWRERYDRLRINTSALTAFLPGGRFPLRYGRWPTRDQLVAYYERYARDNGLDVRPATEVERIDSSDGGWTLSTSRGPVSARAVVVATGKDRTPEIPDWPGRDEFGGELLHVAQYRNPAPFRGRRALVVGCGSSAVDVCLDLVEGGARSVAMAVRTPPHLVRRSMGGVPADLIGVATQRLPRPVFDATARAVRRLAIGDLSPYGLDAPADGFTSRVLERGMIPTIDPGPFVRYVRDGRIRIVPALEALEPAAAVLAGGERLDTDVVVAATGYRCDLEPLVGHLGVLGARGRPLISGPNDLPQARGLHFVGFTDVLTGNLREIRLDGRRAAAAIAAALARPAG